MSFRTLRAALAPPLLGALRVVPPGLLVRSRPLLAGVLRRSPLRSRVENSMAAALGAGGFERRHVDAYFRHLADLVCFSLIAVRRSVRAPALRERWQVMPELGDQIDAALAAGRGALVVGAHMVTHELATGSAAHRWPIATVVRRSPDARYEALKLRWYAALGVGVVHSPGKSQALGEMTAVLRTLRRNHVLAITPDLLQKRGTGVPVRIFGREAELPAGAFFLAARTGAPLIPTYMHEEGGYQLWARPVLAADGKADREAAVADLAQRWAALFEEFLRAHPDMWQFWLDKRWSNWLARAR